MTETIASFLRLRVPFKTAISPPYTVSMAIMGEITRKAGVKFVSLKTYVLIIDENKIHIKHPIMPVPTHQARIVSMVSCIFCSSPVAKSSDSCLTPLKESPRFVIEPMKSEVLFKISVKPMPAAPMSTAAHLFLMIEISMLNPCTPPNSPVYFKMLVYELRFLFLFWCSAIVLI